ncbi:glutamine-hydrolyzing carbamoyl-phosphate synthase small subunit [Alphaproteobacteria bacterium]|jgi:carbamoyl-phosphate synthase small subunit|nr:glutamine-hydrolyzing carbamoyl-phosphate synthase small subunit [Alphaproteobacteria bacterium]
MKEVNFKKEQEDAYIPFSINSVDQEIISDSVLMLEDGTCFLGKSFGSRQTKIGEICFNTSMTGYQEIITDPSYAGQIISFTFPHIGNIGTNNFDNEGETKSIAGIVVRQVPTNPSNWRSDQKFNDWLKLNDIPGISGIDTRMLTKIIRKYKSCNAIMSYNELGEFNFDELKNKLRHYPKMDGLNLSSSVTTEKNYDYKESPHKLILSTPSTIRKFKPKIVVIDFGVKMNILRHLVNLNADVTVLSENTIIEDINKIKPDGIFLSNGPGDPSATEKKCKDLLQAILSLEIPVFGICIGHQLIGLSFGAKTIKMSQGHRGANHPVKNLSNNKVEITSQNHGYMIDKDTLPECLEITHLSLFDGSIEGFKHKSLPIFSVQYHPEASPGPTESSYLFQEFLNLIEVSDNAKTK